MNSPIYPDSAMINVAVPVYFIHQLTPHPPLHTCVYTHNTHTIIFKQITNYSLLIEPFLLLVSRPPQFLGFLSFHPQFSLAEPSLPSQPLHVVVTQAQSTGLCVHSLRDLSYSLNTNTIYTQFPNLFLAWISLVNSRLNYSTDNLTSSLGCLMVT